MTLIRPSLRRPLRTLALAALACAVGPVLAQAPQPGAGGRQTWAWLQGTDWYVPAANLLALSFDGRTETLSTASDQTVWRLTGTLGNYFWGRAVVVVTTGATTQTLCQSLFGSVTPEGRVHLSFVPTHPDANTTVVRATGDMRLVQGRWTVEPQMSSGPSASRPLEHWAYMMQCQANDPACQSLPGLGQTIDSVLAACPGAPTLER
jgi:hypothetical protein